MARRGVVPPHACAAAPLLAAPPHAAPRRSAPLLAVPPHACAPAAPAAAMFPACHCDDKSPSRHEKGSGPVKDSLLERTKIATDEQVVTRQHKQKLIGQMEMDLAVSESPTYLSR